MLNILSAKEAVEIAKEAKRHEDELKMIMPRIIDAAQEGKGYVGLYPDFEYSSKTIDELRELGYKITSCKDYKNNNFSYCIIWADKEWWED